MTNLEDLNSDIDVDNTKTLEIRKIRNLIGDGVDHINVLFNFAKTPLGIALDPQKKIKFVHPELGPFISVWNFWVFVRTNAKNEILRICEPWNTQNVASNLKNINIPDFHKVVADAYYYRIMIDSSIKKEFLRNTLPFVSYSEEDVNGSDIKVRTTNNRYKFIVKALNELQYYLLNDIKRNNIDYKNIIPEYFED